MKISRFYQKQPLKVYEEVALSPVNHRHAIQVLRLKVDEPLILFNGDGGEYYARITRADKRKSYVALESFDRVNRESNLYTTIMLAMIKTDKMDFAIQKMVELGVNEIQPMYTDRSVIKIKANRLEKKMQHWRGIINAACEQSGRTSIPAVNKPKTLTECLALHAQEDGMNSRFVMLPGSHKTFPELKIPKDKVALFVGPEGGFTSEEERLMQEGDVIPVSFGTRILRAETAAISSLTACQLYWGDLLT